MQNAREAPGLPAGRPGASLSESRRLRAPWTCLFLGAEEGAVLAVGKMDLCLEAVF